MNEEQGQHDYPPSFSVAYERKEQAAVRVIEGGRRSGKNAQFSQELARVLQHSPDGYQQAAARMILHPGSEGVIVLAKHDLLTQAREAILQALATYPSLFVAEDRSGPHRLRILNGSSLSFIGNNQAERLRGLEIDWALLPRDIDPTMYHTLIERRCTAFLPQ